MDRMELLAGLQASLDETSNTLAEIAATLSENAAATRRIMDEILTGAVENRSPFEPTFDLEDVLPEKKKVTKGGFDIESENFEEILEQIKNTPASIIPAGPASVTHLPGIKIIELDVSGMSDEEITKHIQDTINKAMNGDDEGTSPYA
jgi:hypothetical protein